MGVFDDKKFQELDWVSQAVEPIDSELNEYLGVLPEETDIDFDTYLRMVGNNYSMNLDLDRAVSFLLKKHCSNNTLTWEQRAEICKCFRLEFEGDDVYLNFVERRINGGTIKLIKLASTLDEKVLEKLLGKDGISTFGNTFYPESGMGRMNEIMEILGDCDAGLRSRSVRKKRAAIHSRLVKLFKDNEWKIKDTTLANKVGQWITLYAKDGNLAAWSNFCRLKVMTHKGDPIYSMEEVQ